jgi:hypothetical protein
MESLKENPGSFALSGVAVKTPCESAIISNRCTRSNLKPNTDGREAILRLHPAAVHLRIVHAHAYGQFLDFLSTGMTGALDLEGAGMELVRPGLVLGGASVAANGEVRPTDMRSSTAP